MENTTNVQNDVFNCLSGEVTIAIGHTKYYGVALDLNLNTFGKNEKEIKFLVKNTKNNFYLLYMGKECSKLEKVHNHDQKSDIEKTIFIRLLFKYINKNTHIYPNGGKFIVFQHNRKSYAFSQDEDNDELILQKVKIIPLSENINILQRSVGNN